MHVVNPFPHPMNHQGISEISFEETYSVPPEQTARALFSRLPHGSDYAQRLIECLATGYLRFGQPERTLQLDHWRRCAIFNPSAIFCRVRWQANDHGTTLWQLMVLQAGTPLDTMQRLPGVRPGARILLGAEGELKVRTVLQQIDAIEAQGIDACTVVAAYWGTLGNRLAAWTAGPSVTPLQLPAYAADRHAAALATRDLS